MKLFHPKKIQYFQGKIRLSGITNAFAFFQKEVSTKINKAKWLSRSKTHVPYLSHPVIRAFEQWQIGQTLHLLVQQIRLLGTTADMNETDRSKIGIFNLLNTLQLLTGIIVPLLVLFNNREISYSTGLMACGPAFISVAALALNAYRRYDAAMIIYFALHPFFTSIIYMSGFDLGIELCFILYGILAVFFIQDITHMLLSVGFSMINYFMLAVVLKHYQFDLWSNSQFFYYFNQLLALSFIFYGLYLIKKENTTYQERIIRKNDLMRQVNAEIEKQKKELTEMNMVKNKLFSVISHDLKTPMYALHNLFNNIHRQNLPAKEIKDLLPDVVKDLSYTMSLMENLLQWAKTQMRADSMKPQIIDVSQMIHDVINLLRLPAEAKHIHIDCKCPTPVYVYADRDMVNLVLRNLISNAIKFTPEFGTVSVGAVDNSSFVEVFITDTGMGMTPEVLRKVNSGSYFTTKGTVNESGTGLGLMLCREFLTKSGGHMYIESQPGQGSTFSFTLPSPRENMAEIENLKYGT